MAEPTHSTLAGIEACVHDLAKRADGGDPNALRDITAVFDGVPKLWANVCNLQARSEQSLIDMLIPAESGRLFSRRGIERRIDAMRQDLAGESPTPTECLLIDRIVTTWLMVQYAEWEWAQEQRPGQPIRMEYCEYLERRVAWAHKQHLLAVKTLETLRRFLQPTVQVNIADKQINMAR